ncbi:MAG: enoyl-CoA hydratase [Deltaproteobacteria bacterium]|nr:enoyl-CoA hydratase [Deltaproteobacteria bacterium]MBW2308929.1 enoyl-CoA hydratase [Deltaproteobacteria bacterium]
MNYETLLVDLSDQIAIVRMNRSENINALEYQLRDDLVDCFQGLSEDNHIRVVILTGIGKAFCAGGDLRELRQRMTVDRARKYVLHVSRTIRAITNIEKPVIAAVNGAAMGAGFSLVLACDLVVSSEEAKFAQAFVKVGLVPDLGGNYFMPRLIGLQKAKELAFTGRVLSARELADLGMINYLVPPEDLESRAFDLAREIAEGPPLALGLTKKLLNTSWNLSLDEMLELEAQTQAACMQSEDHMEGIAAFYEKRKCRFKGR